MKKNIIYIIVLITMSLQTLNAVAAEDQTDAAFTSEQREELKMKLSGADMSVYYRLTYQWHINPNDYIGMRFYYSNYISGAVGLLSMGQTVLAAGIVVMSVLIPWTVEDSIRARAWANGQDPDEAIADYDGRRYSYLDSPDWECVIIGSSVGTMLAIVGTLLSALSAYPFWVAYHLRAIYRKATGSRLSLLQRTRPDIGYAYNTRSLNVGLTIKL